LFFKAVNSGTNAAAPARHDVSGAACFAFSAGSPTPAGPYLLGVAYQDNNSNGAYDVGEGLPNVDVQVMPGDYRAKTRPSGGYSLPRGTTSGDLIVTFSGQGLQAPVSIPVSAMPGQNVKADLALPAVTDPTRILNLSGNLDFGEVTVNGYGLRTLTISNGGNSPLHISGLSHSNGKFAGSFVGTIPVGVSRNITLAFQPTVTGVLGGTLVVNSDATSGQATVVETGRGVIDQTVATPQITPGSSAFKKSLKVKITCATQKATIYYTTDGSEPTERSIKYKSPFSWKEAATIKAKAYRGDYRSSGVSSVTYTTN
jgi:hypothetical protein